MNSLNRATLIGYVGQDPQIRYLSSETPLSTFSLATHRFLNSAKGQVQRTDWHRIVAFKRLAEVCRSYIKKGRYIYVEGRISNRKYRDHDNRAQCRTEIIATKIIMLDHKIKSDKDAKRRGLTGTVARINRKNKFSSQNSKKHQSQKHNAGTRKKTKNVPNSHDRSRQKPSKRLVNAREPLFMPKRSQRATGVARKKKIAKKRKSKLAIRNYRASHMPTERQKRQLKQEMTWKNLRKKRW